MPFHTQDAMEDTDEASVLQCIKTGYRIPGTRLLRDVRTDGFDMDLLHNVTQSTASWFEYDHLAVVTTAQLHVREDDSVKLVLRCQLDVPACTFSFCGRSHNLAELEAILHTADQLMSSPGNWRHEPVQLRKVLSVLSVVSDEAFIWRDVAYPSVESLCYHLTLEMETQVSMSYTWQVLS